MSPIKNKGKNLQKTLLPRKKMISIPRLTLNFVKQRATYPREKNQYHSKTDLGLKIKIRETI